MKTKHLLLIPIAAALPTLTIFAEDTGKNATTTEQVTSVSNSQSASGKDSCKCSQTETELDKLIADMNGASGEKKLDAIAAVVTKLAEEVKATQQKAETQTATTEKSPMDMCRMMMSH